MTEQLHWITTDRFEFQLTAAEIESVPRQGPADDAVETLARDPAVRERMAHVSPAELAAELKEYGAWNAVELADHEANIRRMLWLGALDFQENESEEG